MATNFNKVKLKEDVKFAAPIGQKRAGDEVEVDDATLEAFIQGGIVDAPAQPEAQQPADVPTDTPTDVPTAPAKAKK